MKILLFLGMSVALCSLAFADPPKGQAKDPGLKNEVAADCSNFEFALFRKLAEDNPTKNFGFSPSAIRLACDIGYLATKNNNADQIKEDDGFRTSDAPKKEIHDKDSEQLLFSGNALFVKPSQKIPRSVLNNLQKINNSKAFTVDFENTDDAKKQINSYVEKNTNGNIANPVTSVDQDTAPLLLNFFDLEGKSEIAFDDKSTGDFHVTNDKTVKVPFLSRTGYYNMAVLDEATLVAVPYRGNVSALYILPNDDKMEEVEANLEDIMKKWEERNQSNLVDLGIPTISLSSCLNLKEELAEIGIPDVFSTPSGTTGDSNLNISKVLHLAKANFDEKVKNAPKATGLKISRRQVPDTVNFDRPFLYIIKKEDDYLFLGQIIKPLDSFNSCPK